MEEEEADDQDLDDRYIDAGLSPVGQRQVLKLPPPSSFHLLLPPSPGQIFLLLLCSCPCPSLFILPRIPSLMFLSNSRPTSSSRTSLILRRIPASSLMLSTPGRSALSCARRLSARPDPLVPDEESPPNLPASHGRMPLISPYHPSSGFVSSLPLSLIHI
eukprot:61947-Hanusia_phi.AAC.1